MTGRGQISRSPGRPCVGARGSKVVRLHDLRHTFASIGAGANLGLPIVGKLLGHSQPQTTARYAHLDADPLLRAANLIGERIERSMNPPAATISAET